MEAGVYERTRGTCFVVSCLNVVAVAGLLWIRGVLWVWWDFVFLNPFFFF